jgi:hypothetical protein
MGQPKGLIVCHKVEDLTALLSPNKTGSSAGVVNAVLVDLVPASANGSRSLFDFSGSPFGVCAIIWPRVQDSTFDK